MDTTTILITDAAWLIALAAWLLVIAILTCRVVAKHVRRFTLRQMFFATAAVGFMILAAQRLQVAADWNPAGPTGVVMKWDDKPLIIIQSHREYEKRDGRYYLSNQVFREFSVLGIEIYQSRLGWFPKLVDEI